MSKHRMGGQTLYLTQTRPRLFPGHPLWAKEGEGPLAEYFDKIIEDDLG